MCEGFRIPLSVLAALIGLIFLATSMYLGYINPKLGRLILNWLIKKENALLLFSGAAAFYFVAGALQKAFCK